MSLLRQCIAAWWRCMRGCGYRLLALAGVAMAYLGVLLAASVAVRLVHHDAVHLSWKIVIGFAAQAYFGLVAGAVVGFATVRRWTAYTTDRVRWQLDINPVLLHGGYSVAVMAVLVWVWGVAGVVWSVYIGGWLLPAAVTGWAVVWGSRRWPDMRWLQVATWPLWGLADLSLQRARTVHEKDRDRLLQEEAEAVHSIAHTGRRQPLIRGQHSRSAYRGSRGAGLV
jgi:hypothetical protein